jgi:hypothetical protein
MQMTCDHEGCDKGIATGHALHRVSPKPGPFIGLCAEHFAGVPDPVAQIIEDANHAHKRGDGQ